ncbi:MAG: MBL fold metallo-hydrolase [Candidatus Methanofastidiosia archaeon]
MLSTEKIERVLRIELSKTIFSKPIFPINCFYIDGLLIDTGGSSLSREMISFFKNHPLKKIVNTHYHSDHTGGNHALQSEFGIEILANPKTAEKLENPELAMYLQKFLYGPPMPSKALEIPDFIETENHRFQTIHTPGHTSDHISLYEEDERWIFTGDLVLHGEPREVFVDVNIYDAIDSLRRVSKLEIRYLFPGHGEVFKAPSDLLKKKIEFLENMKKKVLELHENGMDAEEIRDEIFGRERLIAYLSQGKFSALNFVKCYLIFENEKD